MLQRSLRGLQRERECVCVCVWVCVFIINCAHFYSLFVMFTYIYTNSFTYVDENNSNRDNEDNSAGDMNNSDADDLNKVMKVTTALKMIVTTIGMMVTYLYSPVTDFPATPSCSCSALSPSKSKMSLLGRAATREARPKAAIT